jgi:hypothetical protein
MVGRARIVAQGPRRALPRLMLMLVTGGLSLAMVPHGPPAGGQREFPCSATGEAALTGPYTCWEWSTAPQSVGPGQVQTTQYDCGPQAVVIRRSVRREGANMVLMDDHPEEEQRIWVIALRNEDAHPGLMWMVGECRAQEPG